jgi:CheY-like chemotaxis protein
MSTVHDQRARIIASEPGMRADILLVDDVERTRTPLARLLRLRGYIVHEAAHGREALVHLEAHAPDVGLILLDIQMPVMDGWKFRELQLRNPAFAVIPTVMFTSLVPDDSTRRVLRADGYLMKPVTFDQLLHVTARYCRPTRIAVT